MFEDKQKIETKDFFFIISIQIFMLCYCHNTEKTQEKTSKRGD